MKDDNPSNVAKQIGLEVAKALQQARSVSDSEHYDHHKWISERIDSEKAKRQFWEEMRRHVFKWGMVSVISAGFYALYLGLRQEVKAALGIT